MSAPPTPPPTTRRSAATIDRLYVLWIVSSLLLLLLVVVLTLLGSGQLRRQAERLSQHSHAIERLRADLAETQRQLAELESAQSVTAPPFEAQPLDESREEALAVEQRPGAVETVESDFADPVERRLGALLPAAIRPGEDLPYELVDRAAAEEILRLAEGASLDGPTWALVAIVARLLDREDRAERSAAQALAAHEFPHAYYELSCRTLLAQGRTVEALVFANRLQAQRPADPSANLLQAEALYAHGELAPADLALERITSVARLSLPGWLRLGHLLVALERWNRLEALLAPLTQVPREYLPRLNYLRAILAIQRDRLPEALAIIENLLADQPDDYDLRTWRGVALLNARQFQAARQALAHAEERPDRPEAWYWRGMLEVRLGNPAEAIPFFQHALAASQAFAPAYEALGTISLNQGDLTAALQHFENAVAANPRRGSAHFLIAVTRAKLSQPGETARALRTAFHLDPSLLEAARQTEVINQLFSADELTRLAAEAESVGSDLAETE